MNKIKQTLTAIFIAIIFTFVAVATYNLAEPKAYDYMVKHIFTQKLPFDKIKKVHGSDDIVLVVIDDKTVTKYRWPWKRELNCKIFDYFSNYTNIKTLVYDAVFAT